MSSKIVSIVKMLSLMSIAFSLIAPGMLTTVHCLPTPSLSEPQVVSKIARQVDISPGSDYVIRFNAQNQTLVPLAEEPATHGLSTIVIAAIAKSPRWIQPRLTRQVQSLSDPESYASILLNASKQITDEIAFSIACSPMNRVPSAAILKENAEALYEHDQWIEYATIIDNDDGMGNYSSTIQYKILENGTERTITLPPDIYYWYIVHPEITNEDIDAVYGPLWRTYLIEHNDLGYPLLKEKLLGIPYLWDCQAYSQPGGRLWSICITKHPTAIEAISYWIGKTVPNQAIGDRPSQASVIAHEHNGWCGELQKIAVAAQRAALVPSIAACNVGEDHVWREFYDRGWHENDNWWSDSGGAVDEPDVYAYGWGKNMSAIYQWRGDGTILQDTARYIHEDDRITVDFQIKDLFFQPVDGARIVVLVKGPKDITYYKNLILEKLRNIWDKLPEIIKGKLLSFLFSKIETRIDQIPDVINGLTITTWGYTDTHGYCSFELGKNLDYLFLVQEGTLKKPWQLARHNTFRSLKNGQDKTFHITLSDVSQKPQVITHQQITPGTSQIHLSFISSAYQLQQHFTTDGIGRYEFPGDIEIYFLNQENFQRYREGKMFACYKHYTNINAAMNDTFDVADGDSDSYLIFKNLHRTTHVIVEYTVDALCQPIRDHVQIITPHTSLFESPIAILGDTVLLFGIATADQVFLSFDHGSMPIECPVINGEWSYLWNTSSEMPGPHSITAAVQETITDEQTILVIDAIPPSLSIDTPVEGAILLPGILMISGQSADSHGVDHIEVTLGNITKTAFGTTTWNLSWDLTDFPPGDYPLKVKAFDVQGLETIQTRLFVINQSGQTWGPQIIALYHTPTNLTNTSNVILYANVTTTGPYPIRQIILFCNNGTNTNSYELSRYGDFPMQARHEEDPLKNQSNAPLFGKEVGQFSTGQTITYWVVAVDTAQNTRQSETHSFTIL